MTWYGGGAHGRVFIDSQQQLAIFPPNPICTVVLIDLSRPLTHALGNAFGEQDVSDFSVEWLRRHSYADVHRHERDLADRTQVVHWDARIAGLEGIPRTSYESITVRGHLRSFSPLDRVRDYCARSRPMKN